MYGIYLENLEAGAKQKLWIFKVPSFIARTAFGGREVVDVCAKVNHLFAQARAVPDIKYDEIGSIPS